MQKPDIDRPFVILYKLRNFVLQLRNLCRLARNYLVVRADALVFVVEQGNKKFRQTALELRRRIG